MVVVLTLWGSGVIFIPLVARHVLSGDVATYGAVGDMFGAANALFAGLGSAAVFIVLLYDLQHRRAEYRPFVVAKLTAASVSKARLDEGQYQLHIRVEFILHNSTQVPALNASLTESSIALSSDPKSTIPHRLNILTFDDAPLIGDLQSPAVLRFELDGERAQHVVRAWVSGAELVLASTLTYYGLNGTHWVNRGSFSIVAVEDELEVIKNSMVASQLEYIDGTDAAAPESSQKLAHTPVRGSWSQGQVVRQARGRKKRTSSQ